MNKKTLIIIIAIIAVLIGIGVGVYIKFIYPSLFSNEVEFVLKTNGGVPYEWEYTIADEEIVELVKRESEEVDKNSAGGRVNIHYFFKGKKEGTTTITFKYKNITDNTIEREEKHKVKVDKYNKIIEIK